MRRSNSDSHADQQATGIGWSTPKSLRIGSLKHPKGHPLPDEGRIPCLMLRGKWMERFLLLVGSRVMLEVTEKRIVITVDETPLPVPHRFQEHTPKGKKKRVVVEE